MLRVERKENMSTKATKSEHKVVSREEWIAARKKLLEAQKELTRRSDEVARKRQELPWVRSCISPAPAALDRYLAASPAMSLSPVAPLSRIIDPRSSFRGLHRFSQIDESVAFLKSALICEIYG